MTLMQSKLGDITQESQLKMNYLGVGSYNVTTLSTFFELLDMLHDVRIKNENKA